MLQQFVLYSTFNQNIQMELNSVWGWRAQSGFLKYWPIGIRFRQLHCEWKGFQVLFTPAVRRITVARYRDNLLVAPSSTITLEKCLSNSHLPIRSLSLMWKSQSHLFSLQQPNTGLLLPSDSCHHANSHDPHSNQESSEKSLGLQALSHLCQPTL